MRYERTSGLAALARLPVLLFALSALGVASVSNGRTAMNGDLGSVPPGPRNIAVAASSWSGSPQSLVAAAQDLLLGTGVLQARGSDILWFSEPGSPSKYHVVGAFAFTSSASVQQILEALRSVEARLNDGRPAHQGGPLLLELQWVEGVQVSIPGLVLPSPDILGTSWGLNTFVASSEKPFGEACAGGRENHAFCTAVGKEFRHATMTQVYEVPKDLWIGGEFKLGKLSTWAHAHAGEEEILAVAVDALLTADEALHIIMNPSPDAYRPVDMAIEAVAARAADTVVPFTASVPAGEPAARVRSWLEAVRQQSAANLILPRRAAVLTIDAGRVRGVIIGRKMSDKPSQPLARIDTVGVKEGGGAPGEPRVWSVVLGIPVPVQDRK
jgi:hypothetical protein